MSIKVARILSIYLLEKHLPKYIEIKTRRVFKTEIIYFVECKSTSGAWVVSAPRGSDLYGTVNIIKEQCLCVHGVSRFMQEGCLECLLGG